MAKRFLALIITLISLINVTAYAQLTDEVFLEFLDGGGTQDMSQSAGAAEQLIMYLGFLNYSTDSYTPDEKIKYADFKSAMCTFTGLSATVNDDEFKAYMIDNGYAREDFTFGKITANDVLYAFVSVMDSGFSVKQGKTSEAQILSLANDKKILKNVKLSGDKVPTRREFSYMIYNVLTGESLRADNRMVGGDVTYSYVKLLESVYDIHLIKGVVTGFKNTSIENTNEVADEKVVIDSITYSCGELDFRDYVGYTIAAFIDMSEDDDMSVIAYEVSSVNDVVEVASSQVEGVSNTWFKYSDDKEVKQLRLSSKAVLVYNGVRYGDVSSVDWSSLPYLDSDFVLIDNGNSSGYDVVYMWKYEYFTAKFVDETMILFDYGMKYDGEDSIKLDDDEMVYSYLYEGMRSDINCLSSGCGVGVARSVNEHGKKMLTLNTSKRKVLGVIKNLSRDNGKCKVVINDKTYTVSDNFASACGLFGNAQSNPDIVKLENGVSIEATVMHNDILVGAVMSGTYGAYGFLIKVTADEVDEIYRAKLLDTDGNIVTYEFAEKVKYCDGVDEEIKKCKPSIVINSIKSLTGTNPADPTDYRTIVLYGIDSAGKINSLYMPYHNLDKVPGYTKFKNTYDYTSERKLMGESKDDATENFAGYIKAKIPFRRNYWLGQYGILFVVPSVGGKDFDEYYKIDIVSKYKTQVFDNIYLFGVDKFFHAGCSLTYDDSAAAQIPRYSSESVVITGVEVALNAEDEVSTKLNYQKKNTEYSAFVSTDCTETVGSHLTGTKISDLKNGDIVQISVNSLGVINGVRLIVRMSELDKINYKYDTGGGTPIPVELYYAKLLDKDQNQSLLLVTLDPNSDNNENKVVRCGSYKNFEHYPVYYKYNARSKKLEMIDFKDLIPGKDIIIIASLDFGYEIYMIED